MSNNYFRFKQFTVHQDKSPFKVGTDGVLLGALATLPARGSILDAGTGTGLIALMAAQRTLCTVVAVEPEKNSFIQAGENFRNSPWSGRITVWNNTLKEYCGKEIAGSFDCVISNPPYFRSSLKNPDISLSRARHSDSLSSDELLGGASWLLGKEGSLQLILPVREGMAFIAEAADSGFFCNRMVRVITRPGRPARRLVLKFERIKRPLEDSTVTIHSEEGYSPEFMSLTRDFYPAF